MNNEVVIPWRGWRRTRAFDVLVVGSGAAGLAAAVAAEHAGARVALATKGTIQANNSSKAQGGIQAAFGDDDSPELHAEDVMRASHDTADPALVAALTGDAQSAIHWLEQLGCAFTRENGGYRLARCGGASRRRLLQVGDRTGHAITKALREAHEAGRCHDLRQPCARRARAVRLRLARVVRREGRRARRRSRPAPSCSPPAAAATPRPSAGTSSPRTTPTRRAR